MKMEMLKRFIKDERGLEMSEYALLLALIVIAMITVVGLLSDQIILSFEKLTDTLETANTEPTPG